MRDDLAKLQPGAPAPRGGFPTPRDVIFLIVMILLVAACWAVFYVTKDIPGSVEANRRVGYQNRAAICDLQKGIGLHESASCADPHVAPFRDPQVVVGSTVSARTSRDTQLLLCALLDQWERTRMPTLVTTLCPKL